MTILHASRLEAQNVNGKANKDKGKQIRSSECKCVCLYSAMIYRALVWLCTALTRWLKILTTLEDLASSKSDRAHSVRGLLHTLHLQQSASKMTEMLHYSVHTVVSH